MAQHHEIEQLILELQNRYRTAYVPYGTSDEEENGAGFRIKDISATFSALKADGVPDGQYDIQIESYPPGDYIYTGIVTLERLMELIEEYRKPIEEWPIERQQDA